MPSTSVALVTGRDPLEAVLAAGSILLPREQRRGRLVAAAVPVHLAISAFWGIVLTRPMSRRRPVISGTGAGLAIAFLDLVVIGRHFPRIRALPLIPQFADHVAFGIVVGALSKRSRREGKTA